MRYDTASAAERESLDETVDALEASLKSSENVVSKFTDGLGTFQKQITTTQQDVDSFSRSLSGSFKQAFQGVLFDGRKISDSLAGVAKTVLNGAYDRATRPLSGAVGEGLADGLGAILPFADGASFAQGRVLPFANGGVVGGPTYFGMQGGTGLMGEAGPEAIMPLSRGPDGQLGVKSQAGRASVTVNMNITTPDSEGFRKSRSQIAAELSRALSQGARNR